MYFVGKGISPPVSIQDLCHWLKDDSSNDMQMKTSVIAFLESPQLQITQ